MSSSVCSARRWEGNCLDQEEIARGEDTPAEADNTVQLALPRADPQGNESALELQSFNQVAAFEQTPRSQQLLYRRISVVGTIGSGKTTFASKSAQILDFQ